MKKTAKTPAMAKLTTTPQTTTSRSDLEVQTGEVDNLESVLKESLKNLPEIVEVIFKVKAFKEVLNASAGKRGTTLHAIEIPNGHRRVQVDNTGARPKLITKGTGPITFKLKIVDAQNKTPYCPIGIAFKSSSPSRSSSEKQGANTGQNDFPQDKIHLYGGVLYMTASMIHQTVPRYEFLLIIQRQDGKIGIIDPGIENDNLTHPSTPGH